MRAIEIQDKALRLTDRPTPDIQDGHVLIKVEAAGVNRPDILQRMGHYPPPPGVTDIPGLEVAGVVENSASPQWQKGDRVCALLAGGGYAEYAVAPAGQCLPVSDGVSMAEAAGLPETVFTVWNNVFKMGQLKAGEVLLVHGGSSGIGTTAIQMAKALGAQVIVTAGSGEKCKACEDLGADLAINYKTQDFVSEVYEFTNDHGVDVVLDMVGGDYVPRNIQCLAEEGRHVSIAFLNGRKAEVNLQDVMKKRLILTGSTLRNRPVSEKEALRDEIREQIWPLVGQGIIKTVIHDVVSLGDAAKAHEILEQSHHIGKVILKVSS